MREDEVNEAPVRSKARSGSNRCVNHPTPALESCDLKTGVCRLIAQSSYIYCVFLCNAALSLRRMYLNLSVSVVATWNL
jgi:hypothetical protein